MRTPYQHGTSLETPQHFLITRFNVRNSAWTEGGRKPAALDPAWMQQREFIFLRYCLPSVLAQTFEDFRWLVFFDSATKPDVLERISGAGGPRMKLQTIDEMSLLVPAIRESIRRECSTSHVITTRVDNDDILHPDALRKLQETAVRNGKRLYGLTRGLCYRIGKAPVLTVYEHPFTPFLSLCEENDPGTSLETVFKGDHDHLVKSWEFFPVRDRRYWIQLIHHDNLKNDLRGRPRFTGRILRDFGDLPLQRPALFASITAFNTWARARAWYRAATAYRWILSFLPGSKR